MYTYKIELDKKMVFLLKLEYWSSLKLHYNIDIMHVENDICDNVIKTLLYIEWKIKSY